MIEKNKNKKISVFIGIVKKFGVAKKYQLITKVRPCMECSIVFKELAHRMQIPKLNKHAK